MIIINCIPVRPPSFVEIVSRPFIEYSMPTEDYIFSDSCNIKRVRLANVEAMERVE